MKNVTDRAIAQITFDMVKAITAHMIAKGFITRSPDGKINVDPVAEAKVAEAIEKTAVELRRKARITAEAERLGEA
jgi:hypothetical protein